MSYQKWNLEYQRIITNYKMLSAWGYKELLLNAINVLLNSKVKENIDLTTKVRNLKNLKSNLEESLENDKNFALKRMHY